MLFVDLYVVTKFTFTHDTYHGAQNGVVFTTLQIYLSVLLDYPVGAGGHPLALPHPGVRQIVAGYLSPYTPLSFL